MVEDTEQALRKRAAQLYRTMSLKAVGLAVGKSHETVRKWLQEDGVSLRGRGWPKAKQRGAMSNKLPAQTREPDVVDTLEVGITAERIAEHLKVPVALIRKIARKHNMTEGDNGRWSRA